jgi:aldehyde:ferredoxin oxidoreductase
VSSRSPLTGTLFDGNSGGAFGAALRRLDLDYLVVSGACEAPAYLLLDDDGARLLPAADLWGLDVPATLAALKERHGRCEAALIGPAGEAGVLFASVVNNRGRQVGRGGLGAVMGAKRLKAIVLRGGCGKSPGPADGERFAAITAEAIELLKADPITSWALPEFGTSVLVNVLNQVGALPTRNFRESVFAAAEQISGEALRARFDEHRSACPGCFLGCARRVRTAAGGGEGPQDDSIWALGADCGVGDLGAIVEANQACNRLGLDTITMGATIACAMELAELGTLPAAALRRRRRAGAADRGHGGAQLGEELAEGSARFAARHGRPELSMSVKSLELPAYDPRGMTGQGLAFATSNRGGCHLRANMLVRDTRQAHVARSATHARRPR